MGVGLWAPPRPDHTVGVLYVGLVTSNVLSLFNSMDVNFDAISFYSPLSVTMQI